MRATVRSISCDEWSLESFAPADPTCFTLALRIRVGIMGAAGADDFECQVCTPEWLKQAVAEPRWGRHMLIVREYNWTLIEDAIASYVANCEGSDWNTLAGKVARVLSWEFEDYAE